MQWRLKVVKGKPRGHCLSFPSGEFMFGRGPECDVRPNSDLVSRQHCLLQIIGDQAIIRDLGSRNGTLVNGQLVIGERQLGQGDTLQIGPLVLEVLKLADPQERGNPIDDTAYNIFTDTTQKALVESANEVDTAGQPVACARTALPS